MGKSPWDVAALLTAMVGGTINYTYCLDPPHPMAIGVVRSPFAEGNDEASRMFDSTVQALGEMVKTDPTDIPGVEELFVGCGTQGWKGGHWIGTKGDLLLVTDAHEALNNHLSGVTNCNISSVEDLVAWNRDNPVSWRLCLKLTTSSLLSMRYQKSTPKDGLS